MNVTNEFKRNREIFALKHIFYQLYLADWVKNLSPENKAKASLKYFDSMQKPEVESVHDTFFDYLIFNGCEKEYPLSFGDFLQEKLYDYSYIHQLTNGLYEEKYEELFLLDKDLEMGD